MSSAHEMMAATAACNAVWRRAAVSVAAALAEAEPLWSAEEQLRHMIRRAVPDEDCVTRGCGGDRVAELRRDAVPDASGRGCLFVAARAGHVHYLCAAEVAAEVGQSTLRRRWTIARREAAACLRYALIDAGHPPAEAVRTVRRLVRQYRAEARRGWEDAGR